MGQRMVETAPPWFHTTRPVARSACRVGPLPYGPKTRWGREASPRCMAGTGWGWASSTARRTVRHGRGSSAAWSAQRRSPAAVLRPKPASGPESGVTTRARSSLTGPNSRRPVDQVARFLPRYPDQDPETRKPPSAGIDSYVHDHGLRSRDRVARAAAYARRRTRRAALDPLLSAARSRVARRPP